LGDALVEARQAAASALAAESALWRPTISSLAFHNPWLRSLLCVSVSFE
jgi:hypothetical protein